MKDKPTRPARALDCAVLLQLMKTTLYPLLLAAAAGCVCAQTLAPELAPLAAKYKTDLAALETQRAAALAQAQIAYTSALAAAEKTATATGKAAVVAAIATERAALSSGLMTPAFPAGLPPGLQMPRKSWLDADARIRAAEAPRRQAIDAAYLRALTDLQARAAKNPELSKQLAAEKQNALANAPPSATAATGTGGSGKPSTKSAVINGTFDLADTAGRPSGWSIHDSFKVVRDGANNVLHATAGEIGYNHITQEIPVPPRARSVTLSVRVRGKWETTDTKQPVRGTRTSVQFIGADGQKINVWIVLDAGRDAGWKSLSNTDAIPKGSKALELIVALSWVTGNFDFDDVAVEFR